MNKLGLLFFLLTPDVVEVFMKKVFYVICFALWVINGALAVFFSIFDIPVTHIMVICPTLMCVYHYGEKLLYVDKE